MPLSSRTFHLATRGSSLALAQAELVRRTCSAALPRWAFELRIIKTTGDRARTVPSVALTAQETPGLFTKELEVALLRGDADLAVHSLKDLPTTVPPGLRLAAVLERADPRDAFITRADGSMPAKGTYLDAPPGARVGTGSPRRTAQILAHRPDLKIVPIRGNVPTRLKRLTTDTELDAIVLAVAGLARLGIVTNTDGRLICPPDWPGANWSGPLAAAVLPLDLMLPCPGQAAIGVEIRSTDRNAAALCRRINHRPTFACVQAERAFLRESGGGCHSATAALATIVGGKLHLRATSFEGTKPWAGEITGEPRRPSALGQALARQVGLAAGRELFDGGIVSSA